MARVLVDVHFSRASVADTPEKETILDEICALYEKSIATNKEVGMETLLLASYLYA